MLWSLLLIPVALLGDGGFIPESAIAKVTIPDQRALIHYRDGIETLVIDTSVATSSTNLAWILPLPSAPQITPATGGLFPTLEILFSPKIVHDPGMAVVLVAGFFGSIAFLIAAFVRKHPRRIEFAVLLCVFVLLTGLLLPAFGTAGSSGISPPGGVQILATNRVGSFDTVTLRGETGHSVLDWLEGHGFPTTTAHKPVIESYAREGWVFVAAKVAKIANHTDTRIHPLTFRFATPRAVYPLRLTAVNNDACNLELFIFGDKRAEVPGWKVERCDVIQGRVDRWIHRLPKDGIAVGHEYLGTFVSAGDIGTKVVARLSPEEMARDACVNWIPFKQTKPTVFSSKGARTVLLNVWLCSGIASGVLFYAFGGFPVINRFGGRRLWALSCLAAMLVLAPIYLLLPKIEVTSGNHLPLQTRFAHEQLAATVRDEWAAQQKAARNQGADMLPTKEAIQKLISQALAQDPELTNHILGVALSEMDCPGGYTLEQTAEGIVYRGHDLGGAPALRFLVAEDGSTRKE